MQSWTLADLFDGIGHDHAIVVLAEVVLALILAAARPSERNRLRIAVLMLVASLLGAGATSLTVVLGADPGSGAASLLGFVSKLLLGAGSIQVWATLLFRVILPPLRMAPAPVLRDPLIGITYVALFLYLLGRHGVNLGGIIATSAVLTGVIGFSLQDTLANVMGGMSLQLDRSVVPGDVIRVGTLEGVVRETGWRQTSIETSDWDLVLIPNSVLTKSSVVVLGRGVAAAGLHRVSVPFAVGLEHDPEDVIRVVERAFHGHAIANMAATPPPNCVLSQTEGGDATYRLRYGIHDSIHTGSTNSQVYRRIVASLWRVGIALAAPRQEIVVTKASAAPAAPTLREVDERLAAIAGVPILAALREEERQAVAGALTRVRFHRGDVVNYQGEEADYLYIVAKGEASVRVLDADGMAQPVATLRPFDVFGEMGLMTGEPRAATVAAEGDLTCFRLGKDDFKATIERRPEMAEAISRLLAKRRAELEIVAGGRGDRAGGVEPTQGELLSRIKTFFLLE